MQHSPKMNYWLLSGSLFFFFLTWSFSFSLFPIWLSQAIGLSGKDTGIIFSINAIAALSVQPAYGFIQDKLGLKKHLLLFVGGIMLLTGPFFVWVYSPLLQSHFILGAALGGIYAGLAFGAGVGALETFVEKVSRANQFEFGRARMWGSFGWALATFSAGRLFNIDPEINFWAASACAALFLLLVCIAKPDISNSEANIEQENRPDLTIKDSLALFRSSRFLALIVFVMGVSCIYSVYDQQFPVYFAAQFDTLEQGNRMFGDLNSLQVFLEAGGMFLAPFLVNRIGAKNGLILSGVIMAIRIIGSGFATDPISISAMKLLHAAELPIMIIALFKYISTVFDQRLSATIYLVGFQFSTQVAASVLSIVAGVMYDSLGFATSYKIMGLTVASFVVISWFLLSNDNQNQQAKV